MEASFEEGSNEECASRLAEYLHPRTCRAHALELVCPPPPLADCTPPPFPQQLFVLDLERGLSFVVEWLEEYLHSRTCRAHALELVRPPHPTPYTLHPSLYILHTTHYTLHTNTNTHT